VLVAHELADRARLDLVAILTDPGGTVLGAISTLDARRRSRCDPHRPRRDGAGRHFVFAGGAGAEVAILTDPGGTVLG